MNIEKTGFDSAKKLKSQDRLNRWKFAKNVYSIIKNTPKEWSNRIGIYGSWGEGKTSVLEFINTIAAEDKQIVIWFNPWQFTTPEELWECFVITIFETLKNNSVDVTSELFEVKAKKIVRKTIETTQSLSKIIPYAEAGLPILKNFLTTNKKILTKLSGKISDKKIIILIDDLDRTNSALIPQLLFAVKELLDIPGIAFVLAFDPVIVNDSLKANNYIIAPGSDFLDKIIDFPEWLPEPDEETYKRYLNIELSESIDFVDANSVFQIFKYLQKNPRKLKQFVRGLMILKDEITRYRKEDINWILLLLILVLKTYYPKYSNAILTDKELWDWFDTENWLGKGNNPSRPNKAEERLNELISSLNITDKKEEEVIRTIIMHISITINAGLAQTIKYTLDIIQSNSILTWKEYANILNQFEKKQNKALIEKEIKKYGENRVEVLKELFIKTLNNREWLLNQASDSSLDSERLQYTNAATSALTMIRIIVVECGGLVGTNPFLTTTDFSEIYKQISRWLHFTMPEDYSQLREKEKKFLSELCQKMSIDLKLVLDYLKPWFPFRTGAYDGPGEKKLSDELGKIIEARISSDLIDKFLEEGWVYSLFGDENFVEQYILLRKDGHFWTGKSRKMIFELSKNEEKKEVIALNAIHFISLIDYRFFDPIGERSFFNKNNGIIYDNDIMLKIWELATMQVINPRMFSSLENFKDKIKEKMKLELPLPVWWNEIKKLVEERRKR